MKKKINILILDSGIPNHSDIINIDYENSRNFTNEIIDDIYDHQKNITGIISSNKIGVSKNTNIIVGKIFEDSSKGILNYLLEGLVYGNKINPDIINISFGYLESSLCKKNLIIHDKIKNLIKILYDKNIPVVCSAGNNNNNMYYPAAFSNTISVGIYYNYFKKSDYNCNIEYFVTTSKKQDYIISKGSSLATAYLTGIISNFIQENSNYTIEKIKKYITNNNKLIDLKYNNKLNDLNIMII